MSHEITFTTIELRALRCVRNHIVHTGRAPSVRIIMRELGYKSPRSAVVIIDSLVGKNVLKRKVNGELRLLKDVTCSSSRAQTVDIPLVGEVSCGIPMLAVENVEAYIPVSTALVRSGHKYFLLRAKGDSMDNAGINDGDLMLVRKQSTAEDGERVVALIDDDATVKVFIRGDGAVMLSPRSTNKKHKPIILTEDFNIQGVVIATVPKG